MNASSLVRCPFMAVTAHPCPGCGGTRAILSLARGRPREAAGYNLAVTAAVPFGLYGAAAWASRRTSRPLPMWRVTRRHLVGATWALLAFGVARNVGVVGFDRLAPSAS